MPVLAKVFLGLPVMAMAMMALLAAVAAHVFLGVTALGANKATLARIQSWSRSRSAGVANPLHLPVGLVLEAGPTHFRPIPMYQYPGTGTARRN
jgi:hypothetical protein